MRNLVHPNEKPTFTTGPESLANVGLLYNLMVKKPMLCLACRKQVLFLISVQVYGKLVICYPPRIRGIAERSLEFLIQVDVRCQHNDALSGERADIGMHTDDSAIQDVERCFFNYRPGKLKQFSACIFD
jgi:hypothetical protein